MRNGEISVATPQRRHNLPPLPPLSDEPSRKLRTLNIIVVAHGQTEIKKPFNAWSRWCTLSTPYVDTSITVTSVNDRIYRKAYSPDAPIPSLTIAEMVLHG